MLVPRGRRKPDEGLKITSFGEALLLILILELSFSPRVHNEKKISLRITHRLGPSRSEPAGMKKEFFLSKDRLIEGQLLLVDSFVSSYRGKSQFQKALPINWLWHCGITSRLLTKTLKEGGGISTQKAESG